jgi:hypothetical protein
MPVHAPGSTARHHREKGIAVLTFGPTGHNGEGVDEEVRDAVTRKAALLVVKAERQHGEGEAEEAEGS